MGKVMSTIARPIKNFNIEARAHKVISKDKPVAAPKYRANIDEAERLLREKPESMQELLRKDTTLDNHLKDVYVKSHDPLVEIPKISDSQLLERPLPFNRKIVDSFEFGFHEPTSVPIGRCTLRQALKFLTQHMEDADTWNSTKIAQENKIPEEKIKNILEYFRIYKVYIPDKRAKTFIAEPTIPRKRSLQNASLKKLLADEQKSQTK